MILFHRKLLLFQKSFVLIAQRAFALVKHNVEETPPSGCCFSDSNAERRHSSLQRHWRCKRRVYFLTGSWCLGNFTAMHVLSLLCLSTGVSVTWYWHSKVIFREKVSYVVLHQATIRNIRACGELSEVVRTSLGPNGRNKMVINHLERLRWVGWYK